jgi:hypothetical protein
MHEGIPDSELVVFEQSGHFVYVEEAEAFFGTGMAPAHVSRSIHPSAWKVNSANFACTEFEEVRVCPCVREHVNLLRNLDFCTVQESLR